MIFCPELSIPLLSTLPVHALCDCKYFWISFYPFEVLRHLLAHFCLVLLVKFLEIINQGEGHLIAEVKVLNHFENLHHLFLGHF